jgi:subtilisin family serine protease
MRVLVELEHPDRLDAAPLDVALDSTFTPVQLDRAVAAFTPGADAPTYVVRGEVGDAAYDAVASRPGVLGVFSDPTIESSRVCAGDPALGTDTDVARLLDVPALGAAGMDGRGVRLVIVDSGINLEYLEARGHHHQLDFANSWTPAEEPTPPGRHPVDHGTMCAFDAGIAAPEAVLVDHAVLLSRTQGPTPTAGFLSDALIAYSRLQRLLASLSGDERRLVVSNSWGMYDPDWDFPVGHPGNYSDNPRHPFNVIVGRVVAAGADVLFAAGNCGRDCADRRCAFGHSPPICGANSHPDVICVAGIDTMQRRVGYSSQGPGRLEARTPSLCGYTHFAGSAVFAVDGGTSAACPVIAGLVAAIRSRYSTRALSPMQLRSLLAKCADDLGGKGFDFDHGWGVPNTSALLAKLPETTPLVPS